MTAPCERHRCPDCASCTYVALTRGTGNHGDPTNYLDLFVLFKGA